jgi:hypothetical protein
MVVQEITDVCYQHIFSLFTIIGLDSLKIWWPLTWIQQCGCGLKRTVHSPDVIPPTCSIQPSNYLPYHMTWVLPVVSSRIMCTGTLKAISIHNCTDQRQMCLMIYFLRITKKLYVNVWTYYCIQFFISSRHLKNIAWKTKSIQYRQLDSQKLHCHASWK